MGVYLLSPGGRSAHRLPVDLSLNQSNTVNIDSVYLTGGMLFVSYDTGLDNTSQLHNTVFNLRSGSLAYQLDTANIGIPAVVGNIFYAVNFSQGGGGFVSAFRRQDGSRIWQAPISLDPTAYNSLEYVDIVSVAQGLVYVSTFDHTLSCFDARTGAQRWQVQLTGQATAPVISGGSVYFGVWDGSILALDSATGHRRWRTTIGETLSTAPAIDGNTLYISSMDGYLHALDSGSGGVYWRRVVGDETTKTAPFLINFPPVIYHNVVAVASEVPGGIFAYDLRDGSFRWRYTLLDELRSFYRPLVYSGLVVVGVDDGKVYALNP
jgi:outer membrane protein assembly factor BamB